MPLSIMFQLFTTSLLYAGGVQEAHVLCHFLYFSVIYHTCAVGRVVLEAFTLHTLRKTKKHYY